MALFLCLHSCCTLWIHLTRVCNDRQSSGAGAYLSWFKNTRQGRQTWIALVAKRPVRDRSSWAGKMAQQLAHDGLVKDQGSVLSIHTCSQQPSISVPEDPMLPSCPLRLLYVYMHMYLCRFIYIHIDLKQNKKKPISLFFFFFKEDSAWFLRLTTRGNLKYVYGPTCTLAQPHSRVTEESSKLSLHKASEVSLWLKAYTAFAEDPSVAPSTYIRHRKLPVASAPGG